MQPISRPKATLTYQLVTDAGFSVAETGRASYETVRLCQPRSLGPLIELALLFQTRNTPVQQLSGLLSRTRTLEATLHGSASGSYFWEDAHRSIAVIACEGSPTSNPALNLSGVHEASERYLDRWSKFASHLERTSQQCGLSKAAAQGFAGVVQELQDNIFEHCCKPNSGLVGFRREAGAIEIVVADAGVGILGGFKKADNPVFKSHSEALNAVIYERKSRFKDQKGRGNGLRQIFAQLATLQGDLRFRTGDVAFSISGNNFTIERIEEASETTVDGFLVSIVIRPRAPALFAE